MKTSSEKKELSKNNNSDSKSDKNNDLSEIDCKNIIKNSRVLSQLLDRNLNQNFSYYSYLFKRGFLNFAHFDMYDLSYPTEQNKKDVKYYRNTIKKMHPFKIIYNSLISQYISEADLFLSENSFVEVKNAKKKGKFLISTGGVINNYKALKIVDTRKGKSAEYPNSLVGNKNTIFITDLIYNKLKNKNFIVTFSVKQLSNLKITKFLDIKIKKINFKEAIELYAYESVLKNAKSTEYKIYDSGENKIVVMCTSSFRYNNEIKRIYGLPYDELNIEFVIRGDVMAPVSVSGKKIRYLDWLNGIGLEEGNYIAISGKIYRIEEEGFVFTTDGFVIDSIDEFS